MPGRRVLWVGGAVAAGLIVLVGIVAVVGGGGDDDGLVGGGEEGLARIASVSVHPSPGEGLISLIQFEAGPTAPIVWISFSGRKGSDGAAGESAKIKLAGIDGVATLALDDRGLPVELHMPDGTAFRMEFEQDTALVHVLTADGHFGVAEVPLSQEMQDARDGIVEQAATRGDLDSAADEATRTIRSVGERRSGGEEMVRLAASRPVLGGHGPARLEDTKLVAVTRRLAVEALALDEDGEDLGPVLRLAGVDCGAFPCSASRLEYGPTSAGWVLQVDIDIEGTVEVPYSELSVLQAECDRLHKGDNRRTAAVGLSLAAIGALVGGPLGAYIGEAAAVVVPAGFSLLGYYLGVYSMQGAEVSCLEVADAAAAQAILGKESLVVSVTVGSPLVRLEANVGRSNRFQPFSTTEPHSASFVFRGERKSDAELCAMWVTTTFPGGSQVTRPFFAPRDFASKCGGQPPAGDGQPGELRGSFRPPLPQGSVVVTNDITLRFPAGGGDVAGEWNLITRVDLRSQGEDCRFTQMTSGPLKGTYDGGSVLSGTTMTTGSISAVSGCDNVNLEEGSGPLNWSASFDGRTATGTIGTIPFTASAPTE